MSYSLDEKARVVAEQDQIIGESGLSVCHVPVSGGHIALDVDREFLVLWADGIGIDDLVRIGRFLGVIE